VIFGFLLFLPPREISKPMLDVVPKSIVTSLLPVVPLVEIVLSHVNGVYSKSNLIPAINVLVAEPVIL
jgi:hypothetical protein